VPEDSPPTPLDGEAAQRELRRVADDVLPALIARFGAGSLGELEVRQGDWRVRLRRADGVASPVKVREPRDGRSADKERRSDGEAARADRSVVTSPAVGYFQPGDGLDVGRSVRAGDMLGHVDVLGIRHDVVATSDGMLGRIVVEAGEAVEYGQELARVDGSPSRPEQA
jgi:biotin carboxyl carrier protein